ncbi:septal ring lytic transglycosylase RlpA family protein [Elizabethkingia ursingii]
MSRVIFLLTLLPAIACGTVSNMKLGEEKSTTVSYYSDTFNGRKTSSGEIFDNAKLTAAHANLPFGTKVLLTNVATGDTVTVKVNDRGYLHKGRAFDITKSAFKKLGDVRKGVLKVTYRVLE